MPGNVTHWVHSVPISREQKKRIMSDQCGRMRMMPSAIGPMLDWCQMSSIPRADPRSTHKRLLGHGAVGARERDGRRELVVHLVHARIELRVVHEAVDTVEPGLLAEHAAKVDAERLPPPGEVAARVERGEARDQVDEGEVDQDLVLDDAAQDLAVLCPGDAAVGLDLEALHVRVEGVVHVKGHEDEPEHPVHGRGDDPGAPQVEVERPILVCERVVEPSRGGLLVDPVGEVDDAKGQDVLPDAVLVDARGGLERPVVLLCVCVRKCGRRWGGCGVGRGWGAGWDSRSQ